MKRKTNKLSLLGALILTVTLAACGNQGNKTAGTAPEKSSKEQSASASKQLGAGATANDAKPSIDPNTELAKLDAKPTTKGPNGEEPFAASTIQMTDEDLQKVKEKKLTAAISMQYMGNDWSVTQVKALKEQFAKMGVEVVGVTDANFKPDKQTSDIETLMAKKPDILVSIPTDAVAMSAAYKKAAQQGAKIVFMNQAAEGLKPVQDYVTIVSPDDYGNGARGAHYIARELGGKGKIGVVYHAADFPTTTIRYEAFQKALESYPGITIAQKQGIGGPDFTGDAEKAAAAMLLRDPDIKAIWGIWDVPAEGIIAAVRNAGLEKDVFVTTVDLGKNVAIEMAKGGIVKGLGAQTVYDAGITEAKAAALAMIGKPVPPFIAMDGISTDKKNILETWKRVYHEDPPKELTSAVK